MCETVEVYLFLLCLKGPSNYPSICLLYPKLQLQD
jgi:hypothetical protein